MSEQSAESDLRARIERLEQAAEQLADLTRERNHWIGEAKRYERLYRSESETSMRWFKQRNEAREQLAAALAAVEEVGNADSEALSGPVSAERGSGGVVGPSEGEA